MPKDNKPSGWARSKAKATGGNSTLATAINNSYNDTLRNADYYLNAPGVKPQAVTLTSVPNQVNAAIASSTNRFTNKIDMQSAASNVTTLGKQLAFQSALAKAAGLTSPTATQIRTAIWQTLRGRGLVGNK